MIPTRMESLCALAVLALLLLASAVAAGPLPGAIFTTLQDGSRVNANIYQAKEDVYLDGGPGPNAPSTAAALPEGDYYFQVTDPSGKVLLSQDAVKCRKFHVNEFGVIDMVYPATCAKKGKGARTLVDCTHQTGIDQDHSELGAITIQLMPYDNTPNKGGVYKAWVTPCGRFVGDPEKIDNPEYFHGFVPAWSKTDNFKVKGHFCPPFIRVRKFHDSNANGTWDPGESQIAWSGSSTDPNDVPGPPWYCTASEPGVIIAEPPGRWLVDEDRPDGWQQTGAYVDGVPQPVGAPVEVNVAGTSGEIHEVVFGNIKLGCAEGWKWYDRNANGIWDSDEPPVAGWKILLDGVDFRGHEVHLCAFTDGSGRAQLSCELLPGRYTICEVIPPASGWQPTTPICADLDLPEGGLISARFGNVCSGAADFDTKGYWHNKNGLGETTPADLAYLNSLAPWQSPSSYFEAGDEPIDGLFADGTPVAAVKGDWGEDVAPAGSPLAEQSHFLVDSNSGGDPREQLAQQLDAFIMNTLHRLDGPGAVIQLPDGSWLAASELISQAVVIWQTGTPSQQTAMSGLLDSLNNNSAVRYVHANPCPVVYGL